jgi:rRNA maturation protein Nop10
MRLQRASFGLVRQIADKHDRFGCGDRVINPHPSVFHPFDYHPHLRIIQCEGGLDNSLVSKRRILLH